MQEKNLKSYGINREIIRKKNTRIKTGKEVFMQLEKDKLYISFHRPKSLIGFLISAWTLGNYSHCEFIYNNEAYLANPGGVRKQVYKYKKSFDIYELDECIEAQDILDFFEEVKGAGYDYQGILGSQFLWFLNSHDDKKYFCSEFCLNAIDYALQFSLTWNFVELKYKGYHKFNPSRLYKYLKELELIKEKVM